MSSSEKKEGVLNRPKRTCRRNIEVPLHPSWCQQLPDELGMLQQALDQTPSENAIKAAVQSALREMHVQCSRVLLSHPKVGEHFFNPSAISHFLVMCQTMHPAKPRESAQLVSLLLEGRFSPDCTYPCEPSTYYLNNAVKMNLIGVLKLLLQHGAQTEDMGNVIRAMYSKVVYHHYITPLHEAFNVLNIDACKLLFLYGGMINLHKLGTSNGPANGVVSLLHILVDQASFLPPQKMGRHLEALDLFHQFGGDVHLKFHGTTALEYLQTRWPQDKEWGGFDQELQRISTSPLSLLDLSRLAVRNAIGRECLQAIPHLPLPRDLKALMAFHLEV